MGPNTVLLHPCTLLIQAAHLIVQTPESTEYPFSVSLTCNSLEDNMKHKAYKTFLSFVFHKRFQSTLSNVFYQWSQWVQKLLTCEEYTL